MDAGTAQLLFFGVIILALVGLMFRNGRKRQKDQQNLASSLKPGAEIMTTFGLYGTIESIDDEDNRVVIRTGPGATATIHRQAVGKVVTPVADDGTKVDGAPVVLDDAAADPEFGQRVEPDTTPVDDAPSTRRVD